MATENPFMINLHLAVVEDTLAVGRVHSREKLTPRSPKGTAQPVLPVTEPSQRHDLHGDFHPIPGVRWPLPGTGERGSPVLLTGDRDGDML